MNLRTVSSLAGIALASFIGATSAATAGTALISVDPTSPPEVFAADDIQAALRARRYTVVRTDSHLGNTYPYPTNVQVHFETTEQFAQDPLSSNVTVAIGDIRHEGYSLRYRVIGRERAFWIVSRDAAGAMYGGLELAEQIRIRGIGGIGNTDHNPYMSMRGTKFNLPLDVRTPSYTDMGDSAQANIATVWDFAFWRAYLDQLARDRYNYVSLWNLHPFPSMVKVPGYPDVALNDVWRSKIAFDEDYDTNATGLVTPAMLADKEVVKHLTIDEKIEFWRRVMDYAKDRNIEFYVMTWNIFTYGVDGKYGITDSIDNPNTVAYFRASVREMFRTYPLLRGIGLTTGENMPDASFDAKEKWAFATYGQGVLDAANAEPQRQFRLIHRQHQTRAQDIAATFKPLIAQHNIDFVFSFKYAQAHVLSSTTQTFHHGYLESLGDLQTLWTLRNDDALMFRWAAPDFVREFIRNIPHEKSRGYYYGSDMWVWGREFLDLSPTTPRQLEIDKHWLPFLLWGRLGYDPSLDDGRIADLVAQRFPDIDAPLFLKQWRDASMIYPLVTGFHWADFDFQWYIEACRSRPGPAKTASGFHSVETFITQPVHPGTDNIPIPQYVEAIARGGQMPKGTTPTALADQIDLLSVSALKGVGRFSFTALARSDAEFRATIQDIEAMALLGRYYAAKIRGATALALFRETRSPEQQRSAIDQLTAAAVFWNDYTARTAARYRNPMWTNRVGNVDWRELNTEVAHDIAIARAPAR